MRFPGFDEVDRFFFVVGEIVFLCRQGLARHSIE